ncbi:hypothetical protein [Thiolapillus sp.]
MRLIYSIIETAAHPSFSDLYRRLGIQEKRFSNMRKVMAALKKQAPDYIVAEFIYGYSNNYAGVNISNLDVLLYALQKYAPDCRIIVLCSKEECPMTEKLKDIFPLHGVLPMPAKEQHIKPLMEFDN